MLSAFAQPTSTSSSQSNMRYLGGLLITILIVILVLMLIGAVPSWPHSRNWGYRPVGGLGLILLIILILYMLGYV
jgi:VIT1/CCC1 family predicted Fe2+/Mn2+ transporter